MFTTYEVITADDKEPIKGEVANWPIDPGYDAIKIVVAPWLGDGNDMEHVTVIHNGKRTDMFVDEIGALKRLPVNCRATAIYHANFLQYHPGEDTSELPKIHGTAVLFHRRIWY